EVHMLWQNRTCPDRKPTLSSRVGETGTHGCSLAAVQCDWRMFERFAGFDPPLCPLFKIDGLSFQRLGALSKSRQFPRGYEVGPRTPWVIGQPAPIRAPDDVIRMHHATIV